MIAYEITINGHTAAIAGIENGVISCIANWVSLRKPARTRNRQWDAGFRVGGLRTTSNGKDEFLSWVEHRMKLGDKITIRLVNVASTDPPRKIQRRVQLKT